METNTPRASDTSEPIEILNASQAAALLQIHRTTLYESAKRGEIPCGRIGRRFIFERQALLTWLRSNPEPISDT